MTLPLVPAPLFGGGVDTLTIANLAIPYSPPSIRGAWTNATLASPITTKLAVVSSAANTTKSWTEHASSLGTFHADRLGRFGSSALLAPVTISGTMSICIRSNTDDVNNYLRMTMFVTAGATDTVRGTLLLNYQWMLGRNNTAQGRLQTGISLTSVAAQAGDYIIVEFGADFSDSSGYNTESFGYGGTSSALLGSGDTDATKPGWIKFNNISLSLAS